MLCTPHHHQPAAGDELWFLSVVSGTSFVVLGGDAAGAPFPLPAHWVLSHGSLRSRLCFTGCSTAQSRPAKISTATSSC